MPANILLKWGTLKGWDGFQVDTPMHEVLKKYHEVGDVSFGVATQRDNDAQQQALLELIDICDGKITNDWTGEELTKEEAREYVLGYKRE